MGNVKRTGNNNTASDAALGDSLAGTCFLVYVSYFFFFSSSWFSRKPSKQYSLALRRDLIAKGAFVICWSYCNCSSVLFLELDILMRRTTYGARVSGEIKSLSLYRLHYAGHLATGKHTNHHKLNFESSQRTPVGWNP